MDEYTFLGYLIPAIITLGGFVAFVMKMVQPINELRIVVQELKDCISAMRENDHRHDEQLKKHEEKIGQLETRTERLETRVKMYHKDNPS
jgi:predicted nuclease with TOPRIM domain